MSTLPVVPGVHGDCRPWRDSGVAPDLSFADYSRPYATHGLHPFAAKFPPPLARWAIEQFTDAGAWILDPFAGSGTSLVEARLTGRNAVAAELDPLAQLIARVKAQPLPPDAVEAAKAQVDRAAAALRERSADSEAIAEMVPDVPDRDRWFHPSVQRDLILLREAISRVAQRELREFLLVVYSSLIIAKGPSSVANALDIAHSRAHYVERPAPPDVWARFDDRYRRAVRGLREFSATADRSVQSLVLGRDARALPFRSASVDLVLTSPPYVTAIDYPRSHKFSLWWIGDALGVSARAYARLRNAYVGTESVPRAERERLRQAGAGLQAVERALRELEARDPLRSGRARRYVHDMRLALGEMLRTLKPEACAILVVADSSLRGLHVPTGDWLVAIADSLTLDGARLVHRDTIPRVIRQGSRQLPIKRGLNAEAMKSEHVIILQRRSVRSLHRAAPLSDLPGRG